MRELSAARFANDLRRLVECESPSGDPVALAASAALVASIGEEYLGEAPAVLEVGGNPHLLWEFGDPASRKVLVLGHHDTVWPLGTLAEFPATDDGVTASGPGSFDMKAGIIQAFSALSLCSDLTGVAVLITADEELGAPTSRPLIEREARIAGTTLVFEASAPGGAVKTARKGASRYTVVVTGKAAHAGLEPWNGINATVEAARLVLEIAAMSGGPDETTVTPTVLSSGTTANTVPGEATLLVDVRATSAAEQRRIGEQLRALRAGEATVTVTQGPNHDPLENRHSQELFDMLLDVAGRAESEPPGQASVGGASDGNIAAGVGSRVLDGLGAVGAGAHAPGEYVLLRPSLDRAILISLLIERILHD